MLTKVALKIEVEVQKGSFLREKNEIFFSYLILYVPERPKTHFRHNLQIFSPYKSLREGKTAQIWRCNPDASTIIEKDYGQHCVQISKIYLSDDW